MQNNFSYILERLSSRSQKVLVAAQKLSESLNHDHTGTEHLLYGIISEKSAFGGEVLKKNDLTADSIKNSVTELNKGNIVSSWSAKITKNLRLSLEKAAITASRYNYSHIATEHILYGIADCKDCKAVKVLTDQDADVKKIKKQLITIFEHSSKFPDFLSEEQMPSNSPISSQPKINEKIAKSPALDYFTIDLTEKAEQGKIDPVIGRIDEIERLVSILNRRNKNNPVLIGEPGVGKTAVVEGLALRIVEGKVPESLVNKKILSLDLALVVAGSMFRGEFENRLKQVIDEVSDDKNIVLFIDELHTLVGAGATTGSLDAANILKPALARGDLHAIGATTLNEYKKYIENDAALERRFQPILVEEPSQEETIEIVEGVLDNYEKHHGVHITPEAVKAAVELSIRYIPDRFLPDKALDLIDETAANLKTKNESSPQIKLLKALEKEITELSEEKTKAVLSHNFTTAQKIRNKESKLQKQRDEYHQKNNSIKNNLQLKITHQHIAQTVSKITKIPTSNIVEAEVDKLLNLEETLKKRVVGQNEIISEVASAVRRSRLGISSPNRPLGSFIFMGPSGVGKTELAKTLASEINQNKDTLVRVDMSEFMEKHNVARLIGAPAGYVGFEEGGRLTEAIRRKPYSVVLFDEIEKAHPDVFNILLQILEEGELTDASGKKVNFKNTVVIMTSNVGLSELNQEAANFGFIETDKLNEAREKFDQTKEKIISSLKDIMRPELVNRIDKILVFKPLELQDMSKIAEIQLQEIKERMKSRNINITWTKAALTRIAKKSFEPDEGARMVRKKLQELIETRIAKNLLSNPEFIKNGKPVKVRIVSSGSSVNIKFKALKVS